MAEQDGAASGGPIDAAANLLGLGLRAVTAYGRDDLGTRLEALQQRLGRPEVHVAVVGEFKSGKSTLVNALIGDVVCPVDDGWSTTVPTLVRYGETRSVTTTLEPVAIDLDGTGDDGATGGDDGPPRQGTATIADLRALVTEDGNRGNTLGVRLAEVTVDQPVLRGGLVLLDTPGAGGLLSPLVAPTLAALPGADIVLFCTSAAQELTRSELDLLQAVLASCPNVLIGLTKTDLYVEWRRIAELDRAHLADHGIDLPIVPLSAALRTHALTSGTAALNAESGFVELGRRLRDVVASVEQLHARTVATEIDAAATQLIAAFEAERSTLADPDRADEIAADLERTKERAERLRAAGARWVQRLNDGISDLTADVDHGLRQRLRDVLALAEESIDRTDPAKDFDELAAWLQQRVTAEVGALYGELAHRTDALAYDVAATFDQEHRPLAGTLAGDATAAGLLSGMSMGDQPEKGDGLPALGLTALRGGYMSMLMFGTLGALTGLAMLTPAIAAVSVLMSRKAVRDERKRQRTLRRQQAKVAARKYVDEASFRVSKDTRDTLRRLHRELRDQFATRAEEAVRAANQALQSAQQGAQAVEGDRARRLADVEAELRRVNELRRRANDLYASVRAGAPA